MKVTKVASRVAASTVIGLAKMVASAPLQRSLLKPRQVMAISRRLMPMRISTAVGDESAHLSSTTRLIQSRY